MKLIQGHRWPIKVALVLTLLAGWAGTNARASDCYVLSAGVDHYKNGGKLSGDISDAHNTVRAFTAQKGKLFSTVYVRTLIDRQATKANFMKQFRDFSKLGQAGDTFVVFFSGHGGRFNDSHKWFFVPYDSTPVTGESLLQAADTLVNQRKKVVIIIDACFSGQLNVEAQPYLRKHRNVNGGGLIVMCSSSADQLSNALGNYSAFAKSFADAMAGKGDLNHDGAITLKEIRSYTYRRTSQLLKQNNNSGKQDSIVSWSPSISGDSPLGALRPMMTTQPPSARPLPATTVAVKHPAVWTGNETLPGFGRLTFQMHANGHAVMIDAKSTSVGTWHRNGQQITLRFSSGRVVYTGTVNGSNIVGTAGNQSTAWSFSVRRQAVRS